MQLKSKAEKQSTLNVLEFLNELANYYGSFWSARFGSCLGDDGKVDKIWESAIGDFTRDHADWVMQLLVSDRSDFTGRLPNPGELRKLFSRARAEILRLQIERGVGNGVVAGGSRNRDTAHFSGVVENGVFIPSSQYAKQLRELYGRYDEVLGTTWRIEAQNIYGENGGKAYAEFMIELGAVYNASINSSPRSIRGVKKVEINDLNNFLEGCENVDEFKNC